ncbi:MAG: BREX system ATP-binding domain-containing protein [Bradymonadia bacterium]
MGDDIHVATATDAVDALSRPQAMRIIQSLGETGTPPERGVAHINVGNHTYLDVIRDEYLDMLLPAGGSTFKLVQAYYGGGKTHFLMCLRDLAWASGYASAYVGLSPSECPFHEPLAVYRAVVKALRAPPPGDEPLLPTTGLPDLLRDLVEARRDEHGDRAVRAWLYRTVRNLPVESPSLRNAISEYGLAVLDDDLRKQDVLAAWLLGEEVPPSSHREVGVFESITKSNAFAMLRGVCQALKGLEFTGTVLLFDELDRNLSIGATTRNRTRLTDNLREMVDLCGKSALPGVMVAYAVPPEFLRNVVPEYPALQQRLSSPVPLSVTSPQSALIDLEALDLPPAKLLEAIGARILEVFSIARKRRFDPEVQGRNLRALAEEASEAQFEVSHRRIFVKSWVALLTEQALSGETQIDAVDAGARVMGGAQTLLDADEEDDGFDDF